MQPVTMNLLDFFIAPIRDNSSVQVALITLLILIVLDLAVGLTQSLITKTYSSKTMRLGLGHKIAELCAIPLASVLDTCISAGLDLGGSGGILIATCVYIILMEAGSILELLTKLNPELGELPVFKHLQVTKENRDE